MFTGIIKEIGKIRNIKKTHAAVRIEIEATTSIADAAVGDSIAVNGCCLTIVQLQPDRWSADVVEETLKLTCLGDLKSGDPVNLEPALRLSDRLGGHLVQGHVDGIGKIADKSLNADGSITVKMVAPAALLKYIVKKGSIAVDGVSLTVAEVTDQSFAFAMIPHTAKMTNLGWKQPGQAVNLEVDLVAKYIEKMIRAQNEHN